MSKKQIYLLLTVCPQNVVTRLPILLQLLRVSSAEPCETIYVATEVQLKVYLKKLTTAQYWDKNLTKGKNDSCGLRSKLQKA